MEADVIVVGAGAFGCNAAWHLRRRGLDVLVVDGAGGPATQATGAAATWRSSSSTGRPSWTARGMTWRDWPGDDEEGDGNYVRGVSRQLLPSEKGGGR